MENLHSYVKDIKEKKRTGRRRAVVLLVLSALITSGVLWALRGTGVSMTGTLVCGKVEHQHAEGCYQNMLVCGQEEWDHAHAETCYQSNEILICGQEESAPVSGHSHGEDCYDVDGSLICDQEEREALEGHTHTDSCYQTEKSLVCGLEEGQGHQHTQGCYEHRLVCEAEEHRHTEKCYTSASKDVESAAVWERTLPGTLSENWDEALLAVAESQLGYRESGANYILNDNGNKKGYTRYGDWYGSPYGDWCAMFISFCMHYAGIPEEAVPYAAGCYAWQVQLNDLKLWEGAQYTPAPGDIVFFDRTNDGRSNHVGIVESVDDQQKIHTIEGNTSNRVARREYAPDNGKILGYCNMGIARMRYGNVPDFSSTQNSIPAVETDVGEDDFYTDQTAQVIDYVNRTYQIDLSATAKKKLSSAIGVIRNTLSGSFYPIDPRNDQPLQSGTWIDLQGNVLDDPDDTEKKNAGQVLYDEQTETWCAEWSDQVVPVRERNNKWSGRLYVKAKEDFIGGNAIDISKSATPFKLVTPTVNVRLLEMDEYRAKATVFLGDMVNRDGHDKAHENGIPDVLEDFYGRTGLPHAVGELTKEQWDVLKKGGELKLPYTYDDDSSHGAVGEFTMKLRHTCKGHEDNSWAYGPHTMHEAGKDVCKYYLDTTYTAYDLQKRARKNVHNGTKGPGTEVGGDGTDSGTVKGGLGTYTKTHEYDISVIDGKITVKTDIDQSLVSDRDQVYSFCLSRLETGEDGVIKKTPVTNDTDKNTVTIRAGETESEDQAVFCHLKRGTYLLEEPVDVDSEYYVNDIEIQGNDTNCAYQVSEDKTGVIFRIGYRPADADGVEKDVITYGPEAGADSHTTVYARADEAFADYHGYSHGLVKIANTRTMKTIEIPVRSVWSSGLEARNTYVALCDQNGHPVLNSEQKVQLLCLKEENDWNESFTVSVPDDVEDLNYTIREVPLAGEDKKTPGGTKTPAVIVNEENSSVYVEKTAEDRELIGIGDEHYLVEYNTGANGTLIVTNRTAYRLPELGGVGTAPFVITGMLLMAGAVLLLMFRRRLFEN